MRGRKLSFQIALTDEERAELERRCRMTTLPVGHCSWLNQVEQWFGIIQRKLLRLANYPSCDELAAAIQQYIAHWNARAHPFNWTSASLTRVMAPAQSNCFPIPTP